VGGESHAIIEGIDRLRPDLHQVVSNRLTEEHAGSGVAETLRARFLVQLRTAAGVPYMANPGAAVRMLEKTPKNSLRIPFLNKVFPDARFIFLTRRAPDNISSIIEAWRSGRFITYRNLAGWTGTWSLLLPPGYQGMLGKSLGEIAAFQWRAANSCILDDLEKLPDNRWTAVAHDEFLEDPRGELQRLCDFAAIPFDQELEKLVAAPLPCSRYTLTAPGKEKWRANAALIEPQLPMLESLVDRMCAVLEHKRGM
jgi:hypothetical protein